ncbi:MAG: 2-oxo acid dehydrogenase subunit E2 [Candidatus Lokiarchaeota archaeon]|nr:2-oxo acid dehydrogenase subunit E2 [Candidatus Lokiarchaeota archaeon]
MGKKKDMNYEIQTFYPLRRVISETFSFFEKKHYIHALVEIDITKPRTFIHEHLQKAGEKLSFTAFIIYCVGKTVDENKVTHAYRKGRKKLIIFDDVDITAIVERSVDGESLPTIHITRAANKKTLREIHEELRAAQVEDFDISKHKNLMQNYLKVPRFFRKLLSGRMVRNPFLAKKYSGTVILTAVGMFGQEIGWMIPYPGHSLTITVGGITKKPGVIDGKTEIREYINIAISFDHDIIDGAPAARFVSRLKEFIESGLDLNK